MLSCFNHVLTLRPMDCSLPGSSVHGIFQARILKWVAIPFSRESSQTGDWIHISYVSCIRGGFFIISATWEALTLFIVHWKQSLRIFSNMTYIQWTQLCFSYNTKWTKYTEFFPSHGQLNSLKPSFLRIFACCIFFSSVSGSFRENVRNLQELLNSILFPQRNSKENANSRKRTYVWLGKLALLRIYWTKQWLEYN